jgi:hypothetical protein
MCRHFGFGAALGLVLLAGAAAAQSDRARPIRVTINHASVISLQQTPAVVLIANPDIADIVSEKNNLIFVLGRKPGSTNLLVYDENGEPLLSREIVVSADVDDEVTITRETDVTHYYCDPSCVLYEREQSGVAATPIATAGGTQAGPSGARAVTTPTAGLATSGVGVTTPLPAVPQEGAAPVPVPPAFTR